MKQIKFSLFIALMAISTSLCLSQQADKGKITSAAKEYIDKLSSSIQMTESQKTSLKESVINYFSQLNHAKSITDKEVQKSIIISAEQTFSQKTDSILTPEQRETIRFKSNERAETSSRKNGTK